MGGSDVVGRPKVILVPYPAQGHVTPITKLALALHGCGFDPFLVVPGYLHRLVAPNIPRPIECVPISDGVLDKDGTPRDFFAVERAMEESMPAHLERLMRDLVEVAFVVVDLIASWAIEVADRCGVPVAGFFTAMRDVYEVIVDIPDMVRDGIVTELGSPQDEEKVCYLKKQDDDQARLRLSTEDLPWLIGTPAARNGRFKFWTRTLNRWASLKWIVMNSFPQGDKGGKDGERSCGEVHPRIFLVGPIDLVSVTRNPSFWEEDESCLSWLKQQEPGSVIYISFGSWVSPIGEDSINNLALSLKKSGKPFLWVLGKNWRNSTTEGCLNGTLEGRGKVVPWAPQLEVLKNEAVGCYLTHCGWNSTMEAIRCKKRMICYPVAGDQFINCKYITQVWKVGVQITGFGDEELEEALARVIEDDGIASRLEELQDRVTGEAAITRVQDNLNDFVDEMKRSIALTRK